MLSKDPQAGNVQLFTCVHPATWSPRKSTQRVACPHERCAQPGAGGRTPGRACVPIQQSVVANASAVPSTQYR